MAIGERSRIFSVQNGFSQSAIERGNGLRARSVLRIENGISVRGLETLKRMVSVETGYESSHSRFVRRGWSNGAGSR